MPLPPKRVEQPPPSSPEKRLPVPPQINTQRGIQLSSDMLQFPSQADTRSRPSTVPLGARKALGRILRDPRTLFHLLYVLSWRDFHALSSACRDFRQQLSHNSAHRDVILCHFVPGYREALQIGDLQHYREVEVDFHDLTMLVMSQYVPLHKYPMHSLSILNALQQPAGSSQLFALTQKYVALTKAHSRFVLLLQSLVHSPSSAPTPSSDDESDDALGFLASSQPRTDFTQFPGVRELVFPAPLSYFGPDQNSDVPAMDGFRHDGERGHRRHTAGSSVSTMRAVSSSPTRPTAERHLTYGHLSHEKHKSHSLVPILTGHRRLPPPPPLADPPALKYYSDSWRRSRMTSQTAQQRLSVVSDDQWRAELKHPVRRFETVNISRESSLSNSSPSSSSKCNTESNTESTDSRPSVQDSREPQPSSFPMSAFAVPRGTSPHDLFLATSRTRAPVLRTFVPCTELDEHAIAACEEQLLDAGLWEHLSVGDIVCNFGYVPPPEIDDATHPGENRQKWLLFDGYNLVQYTSPSPPPLENPLTLPSPFYYAHILPPFSNPVHNLSLPALPRSIGKLGYNDPHMQLTLAHLPTRVRSPKSPSGFAIVSKYVWLARLPCVGPNIGIQSGLILGTAWQGEWMLEGEGTREGKQSLLDALTNDPSGSGMTRRAQWEIVRDKSGGGRLWMRLLMSNVDDIPSGLEVSLSELVTGSS
ncbi:hypothetical protein BKA93DRAFT_818539 [Sparassis latifolia]